MHFPKLSDSFILFCYGMIYLHQYRGRHFLFIHRKSPEGQEISIRLKSHPIRNSFPGQEKNSFFRSEHYLLNYAWRHFFLFWFRVTWLWNWAMEKSSYSLQIHFCEFLPEPYDVIYHSKAHQTLTPKICFFKKSDRPDQSSMDCQVFLVKMTIYHCALSKWSCDTLFRREHNQDC